MAKNKKQLDPEEKKKLAKQLEEEIAKEYDPEITMPEEDLITAKEMVMQLRNMRDNKAIDDGNKDRKRVVVLLKDMQQKEEILTTSRQEFLQKPVREEPDVALIDDANKIHGKMPIHQYMNAMSIDRLIDAVNYENLSMTHSAIPEACYSRIEDGDEKGDYAFAGSLIGEAIKEENRDMSLTRNSMIHKDDVIYEEVNESAIKEAEDRENLEEFNDRIIATDDKQEYYYTTQLDELEMDDDEIGMEHSF